MTDSNIPAISDGATFYVGSDRYAATVIDISSSGKTVKIQEDISKRIDNNGISESQEYAYIRNPRGAVHTCRLTLRGWFISNSNSSVMFGVRDEYHDPNF